MAFHLHLQLLWGLWQLTWAGMSPRWGRGASSPGSPGCHLCLLGSCRRPAWAGGMGQRCPHRLLWAGPPWHEALAEPSADTGRYKLPFEGVLSFLRGPSLRLEGWWPSWGGCGSAGWPQGRQGQRWHSEVPDRLCPPHRRTASSTSQPSSSSCCPCRGRGWNHLTGMAHGMGGWGSAQGDLLPFPQQC